MEYEDIYRHLEGKNQDGCDVIGTYVVLMDNYSNFLCVDFDDKQCKHGYQNDVLAFVDVCKDWKIPCSIERSRSDKLTVFEVVVTDATNEALETNSAELGINSAKIAELIEFDGIFLIQNTLCKQYSSAELLEIVNLARTQQKLSRRSSRTFISTTLKKVLGLGLLKPLYPDTPHHPKQKYLVTELGKAYKKALQSGIITK